METKLPKPVVLCSNAQKNGLETDINKSKKAVINLRDGYLSLVFRVSDFRKAPVIGVSIKAWLLQHRITPEGELLPYYQYPLQLNVDCGGTEGFVFWPAMVVHRIDTSSPLFNISDASLAKENFEILVVLNGTIEATGQMTEARTSYIPTQILWGHRFKQMIKYCKKDKYTFALDFSRFDETFPVETPVCSAEQLLNNSTQLHTSSLMSENSSHSSYNTL